MPFTKYSVSWGANQQPSRRRSAGPRRAGPQEEGAGQPAADGQVGGLHTSLSRVASAVPRRRSLSRCNGLATFLLCTSMPTTRDGKSRLCGGTVSACVGADSKPASRPAMTVDFILHRGRAAVIHLQRTDDRTKRREPQDPNRIKAPLVDQKKPYTSLKRILTHRNKKRSPARVQKPVCI